MAVAAMPRFSAFWRNSDFSIRALLSILASTLSPDSLRGVGRRVRCCGFAVATEWQEIKRFVIRVSNIRD